MNISEQLITFIPIAAVFSAIVTLIIRRLNEKRSKIERTIRLHESYLNPDFYQKVRAPSSVVGIQWMHLPEELKQIYRHTVCSGWEMQQGDEKLLIYVPDFPKNEKEIVKYHFNDVKSHGGLTEHQSLTSILRFWTRLNIYRKRGMLDDELLYELFKDEFTYQMFFYYELSEYLEDQLNYVPQWVHAIKELTVFFDTENKK